MSTVPLEIAVLGSLQVTSDAGSEIALRGAVQRRLLGALVLRPIASVDWLCDATGLQTTALRTAVSRLRTLLGAEAIITGSSRYELVGARIDAAEFEAALHRAHDAANPAVGCDILRDALALWRGEAYEDFAYEEWARSEATRLEQLRLGANEDLIEQLTATGELTDAIARASALVIEYPYQDRPRGLLMVALATAGRTTDALREFQRYRTVLGEEIGTVPSQELAAIEHRIAMGGPGESSDDGTAPAAESTIPTARHRSTNLPSRLSSFVGRTSEANEVRDLLDNNRLVTIIGTGGSGKTSLAHHIASEFEPGIFRETWWLGLSAVSAESEVAHRLAAIVGARTVGDETVEDALVRRLHDETVLLVLDNCEHVLTAVAPLAATLLAQCGGLSILATSRHALEVPGEVGWQLPSLSLDGDASSDAARLFVGRAQEACPTLAMSEITDAAIRDICRTVDGIPLAIELAASRMRMLAPEQILDGLTDMLGLLSRKAPGRIERHQTLEASIQWSVNLLTDAQQLLLHRVSYFAGFVDLDAVLAVSHRADHQLAVVEDLEELVAHSLVVARHGPNGLRFGQLEMIRQFGAVGLAERDETADIASRHARHFAEVALELGPLTETAEETSVVARLGADHADLTKALNWIRSDNPQVFVEVATALGPYWTLSGATPEGVKQITDAIESAEADDPLRPRLYALRGQMRGNLGNPGGALRDCQRAIDQGTLQEDDWAVGRGLWRMADYASYGDLDSWRPIAERAVAACERGQDRFAYGYMRVWQAVPYLSRGHISAGDAPLNAAQHAVESLGNPTLKASYNAWLAWRAYHQGDLDTCEALAGPLLGAAEFRLPIQQVFLQRLLSGSALLRGQPDPIDDIPELIRAAHRAGEPLAAIMLTDWDAHRLLMVDLDSAVAAADRSFELTSGAFPMASFACIVAGWVAWASGDVDELGTRIETAKEVAGQVVWPLAAVPLLQLQALHASALGRHDQARTDAMAATSQAEDEGLVVERIRSIEVGAIVARAAGTPDGDELLAQSSAERDRLGLPRSFKPLVNALS